MGSSSETAPLADIRFHLPAPALRELVTSYHILTSDTPVHENLHPEWANLRFALSGRWDCRIDDRDEVVPPLAALSGPTDRTRQFTTSTPAAMIGVGLTPLGWVRLIGGDASAVANAMRPLGGALGTDGNALAQALAADATEADWIARLDGVLLARLAAADAVDPTVVRVMALLARGDIWEVPALAEAAGVSERTLRRVCEHAFGFTPKRLLCRQRFLRTLDRIGDHLDQPLGTLLDGNYYDQAHFIRDFQTYMATSPSAYFASPRAVMRRVAIERRKVIGETLQGLHKLAVAHDGPGV